MYNVSTAVKGIAFLVLAVFVLAFYLLFFPWKFAINVGSTHTGYVTAVENTGIIKQRLNVYFKTDTSSSQEDVYCVVDNPQLKEQLLVAEANHQKLTIRYNKNLTNYCEDEIIDIAGQDQIFDYEKNRKQCDALGKGAANSPFCECYFSQSCLK